MKGEPVRERFTLDPAVEPGAPVVGEIVVEQAEAPSAARQDADLVPAEPSTLHGDVPPTVDANRDSAEAVGAAPVPGADQLHAREIQGDSLPAHHDRGRVACRR